MRMRYLSLGIASLLVAMSLLAFGPLQVPGGGMMDGWGGGYGHGYGYGGQLPPALAFLRQIPPGERFAHFQGGTMTVTDSAGTPHVLTIVPGTVQSVGATSVTVMPNGKTTAQTFNITSGTAIESIPNLGSLQALAKGDQVVVLTVDNSTDAAMIAKYMPFVPTQTPTPATPTPAPSPTP